ncbi:MAG: hypothetical protein QOI30_2199, partial [Mycobacterium sp.]|nr:hypothetical protein [Mycobacterium sp.]
GLAGLAGLAAIPPIPVPPLPMPIAMAVPPGPTPVPTPAPAPAAAPAPAVAAAPAHAAPPPPPTPPASPLATMPGYLYMVGVLSATARRTANASSRAKEAAPARHGRATRPRLRVHGPGFRADGDTLGSRRRTARFRRNRQQGQHRRGDGVGHAGRRRLQRRPADADDAEHLGQRLPRCRRRELTIPASFSSRSPHHATI